MTSVLSSGVFQRWWGSICFMISKRKGEKKIRNKWDRGIHMFHCATLVKPFQSVGLGLLRKEWIKFFVLYLYIKKTLLLAKKKAILSKYTPNVTRLLDHYFAMR